MSGPRGGIERTIASLLKRVAALEAQMQRDANLAEVRDMLADVARVVGASRDAERAPESEVAASAPVSPRARTRDTEHAPRPPSHVLQTRFRVP